MGESSGRATRDGSPPPPLPRNHVAIPVEGSACVPRRSLKQLSRRRVSIRRSNLITMHLYRNAKPQTNSTRSSFVLAADCSIVLKYHVRRLGDQDWHLAQKKKGEEGPTYKYSASTVLIRAICIYLSTETVLRSGKLGIRPDESKKQGLGYRT